MFERFNVHQRIQHIMMFSSFILLTITGLPIKYSQTDWAKVVVSIFGGFDNMFTAHLIGAVVMIASAIYHILYLILYPMLTKKMSTAALPSIKDFRDVLQNMQYMLGLTPEAPKFGRYSYKEKFDYWAVFWGMVIMAGSGLLMWFPGIAADYFPRWFIASARIAHSDEAMLAILAIFIWHFYNVHFSPSFFPMSFVWLHGKMSKEMMEHEHPLELAELTTEKSGQKALINKVEPKVKA
ncbi:formate dehydrogenase subunit gamma [Zhaonella formicivorans]|uniref:formate dehydrogenase subunit gamma n=1 Tax=Zhaonella formicivorans TaxID=2528593 RepID=UPI0010DF0F0F|nr:cytochrome b/b6 domain-containing protein [Zhaonella formicivorans]